MDTAVVNMEQTASSTGQDRPDQPERPYRLRKLQAKDIPVFARIIGRIGIDELVSCYGDEDFTELLLKMKHRKQLLRDVEPSRKDIFQQESAGEAQARPGEGEVPAAGSGSDTWVMGVAVAVRIANKVIQRMDRCMEDIYGLLSGLSGLSPDDVSCLDIDVFIQMVTDVVTGNNFVNFIRAATKFMK